MQKIFLAALVLALLGYVAYQNRAQLKPGAPKPPGTLAKVMTAARSTAAAARDASGVAAVPASATAAGGSAAVRAQVEPLLKPLKVTSILPGDPAAVIINKQDYSVGENLKLPAANPGAKPIKVTAIDEGGVTLVCQGETFHLDAPAAPDLAASRKKL